MDKSYSRPRSNNRSKQRIVAKNPRRRKPSRKDKSSVVKNHYVPSYRGEMFESREHSRASRNSRMSKYDSVDSRK